MQQPLRVNSAALQAMAARWATSVGELDASAPPAGLGLSCQASVAAVLTAHTEVNAFTAALSARVRTRATHAPVEAPPAPKVPPPVKGGGGFGGGPAIPFGPTLEPPPHAGHHHPPVIGDMDPDPWDHGD